MKLGAKAKALHSKIADKGGNFIANKVMLQPSLDRAKGQRADMQRQQILAKRDRRSMERNFK